MAIAFAIFLMLLGGFAAVICLYQIFPVLLPLIGLGCGLYIFTLGAIGFGIETGKIENPSAHTRSP